MSEINLDAIRARVNPVFVAGIKDLPAPDPALGELLELVDSLTARAHSAEEKVKAIREMVLKGSMSGQRSVEVLKSVIEFLVDVDIDNALAAAEKGN